MAARAGDTLAGTKGYSYVVGVCVCVCVYIWDREDRKDKLRLIKKLALLDRPTHPIKFPHTNCT